MSSFCKSVVSVFFIVLVLSLELWNNVIIQSTCHCLVIELAAKWKIRWIVFFFSFHYQHRCTCAEQKFRPELVIFTTTWKVQHYMSVDFLCYVQCSVPNCCHLTKVLINFRHLFFLFELANWTTRTVRDGVHDHILAIVISASYSFCILIGQFKLET